MDSFRAELTQRLPTLRASSALVGSVVVEITGEPGGHRARVDLIEHSGAISTRELHAGSCADTAAAAAVSIAVLLDALSEEPMAAPVSTPAAPAPSKHAADSGVESRWQAGVGVGVMGAFGLSPRPLAAPELVLWLAAPARGAFAPELDLVATYATSETLHAQPQSAHLYWAFGRAAVCPVAFRAQHWAVHACALAEAGVVTAATQPSDGKHATRPWLAPGLSLRWRAEVFDWGFVRTDVGAVAPLWTYRFRVDPSATFYHVPRFGLRFGIDAGVQFL